MQKNERAEMNSEHRTKLILKETILQRATHAFWLPEGTPIPETILFHGRIYRYSIAGSLEMEYRQVCYKEIPHLHIDFNTPYAE